MNTRLCIAALALLLAACSDKAPEPSSKPEKQPHLVNAQTVEKTRISLDFERTGSLKYRKQVSIYNQEAGQLVSLPGYEGDQIQAGQELARLDDALLRAELDKARASKAQAERDLARIKELVPKGAASKDDLAQAGTALDIAAAEHRLLETRLGYTKITAPISGVLTQRLVEPGDVLKLNTHILSIADPSSLITEVQVSELLLPGLAVGDKSEISIDALGPQNFQGRISRIHPQVDAVSRMGTVEITLDPVPPGARAGQFVRVRLHTGEAERTMIPFAALRRDQEGEFVFLIQQGKAVRQAVSSSLKVRDQIEIIQGLNPGDRLITAGFLGLSLDKEVKE